MARKLPRERQAATPDLSTIFRDLYKFLWLSYPDPKKPPGSKKSTGSKKQPSKKFTAKIDRAADRLQVISLVGWPRLSQRERAIPRLLGFDDTFTVDRRILETFRAAKLDSNDLLHWRALICGLVWLHDALRKPGRPDKWHGGQYANLIVAASKYEGKSPASEVAKQLIRHDGYNLKVDTLRKLLRNANDPDKNEIVQLAFELLWQRFLEAKSQLPRMTQAEEAEGAQYLRNLAKKEYARQRRETL